MDDPNYEQNWGQYRDAALKVDPKIQLPDQPPSKDVLGHIRLAYTTDEILHQEAAEKRAAAGEQRASMMAGPQLAKATAEAQSAADKAAGKSPIQPEEQARLDLQARANEQTATHNAATEKNATALLNVAQGRLGVEQKHADIAQNIYDQTYGSGANPALQGVEPKLRVQASTAAQKAADEYTKAVESTGNMKSILDLARSGNKVAYAYAPTTGVLTINTANGVKRVNMAEIKSYGGAGSALDRVEGWLGKQATGASIPKDILDNMEQVNKTISDNAGSAYNTKLGSINQNYRSNFQPVKVAGESITVTDPNGGKHAFKTQADADAFKKAAGIQ